jgi:hypothetical protein
MSSGSREIVVWVLFVAVVLVVQKVDAQTSPHGTLQWACESCHTTDSWTMRQDASFDHTETGFSLEGQHQTVQCVSCHKELRFTGATHACTTCHVDVHKAELGPACTRCHSSQTWKITDMMQRHQLTRFPLLGRHATLNCQECHAGMTRQQYKGTPITCYGCHWTDYQETSNPDHTAAGFSTECGRCHKANVFQWGTGFNHSLTSFPLTGKHTTTSCTSCHISGNYQMVYSGCYACHTSEYKGTTNPVHSTAGFPTTCETCHSTTAWTGATLNHTWFPQNHGNSGGVCLKCHTNSANYAVFSCTTAPCHLQAKTDASHRGRTGYVYNSSNCYTCHPRGSGG